MAVISDKITLRTARVTVRLIRVSARSAILRLGVEMADTRQDLGKHEVRLEDEISVAMPYPMTTTIDLG